VKLSLQLTAIILGLAFSLGFLVGSPLLHLDVPYDPDTQTVGEFYDLCFGGSFLDPSIPADSRKIGEIASRDVTYLSWVVDGTSLPVSVSATSWKCRAGLGTTPVAHRYQFDIRNGLASSYQTMHQDDFADGYIQIAGGEFYRTQPSPVSVREVSIDGTTYENDKGDEITIESGAVLRITFVVGIRQLGGIGACCDWFGVAYDEVRLISGIPHVQRGADQYEVGETGQFRWEIPFVETIGGGSAYYLTLTDENTGRALEGWDRKPLAAKDGVATFSVTADLFSTAAGARNAVRARIHSPLFLADVEDVTVIDDKDLAPRVLAVDLNQREYREGDPITLTISAAPNPVTREAIVRYHVLLHIGGDILYDEDTSSSTVSAIASRTGILEGEVVAYDASSRPSPIFEVQATVGNVVADCERYPSLPQCGPLEDPTQLVVVIVFAVIGLIFGAIVARKNLVAGAIVFFVFLVAGLLFAGSIA
jgi:hypothetical protein